MFRVLQVIKRVVVVKFPFACADWGQYLAGNATDQSLFILLQVSTFPLRIILNDIELAILPWETVPLSYSLRDQIISGYPLSLV